MDNDNLVYDSSLGWIDPDHILESAGVESADYGDGAGMNYYIVGKTLLTLPFGINPEVLRTIVADYEARQNERH